MPLRTLWWRDMLAVGTLVNLVVSFVALMFAAQGASTGLAFAVHFAPLPYNLFLFAALWRSPQKTPLVVGLGLAWVAAMTVV